MFLSRVSHNLMYVLQAISFQSKLNVMSKAIPSLSPHPNPWISALSLHTGLREQLSCALWWSLVHCMLVPGVIVLVHRAWQKSCSIVGSCKAPVCDNCKQDISAGKCFIPCGSAYAKEAKLHSCKSAVWNQFLGASFLTVTAEFIAWVCV